MAFHYKPPNSKTWRIGYWDGVTGKRITFSAKTRIEAEAKKKAKEFSAQQRLGISNQNLIDNPGKSLKLGDAFKLFLSQRKLKPSTIRAYKLANDTFIKVVGDKSLYQLSNYDSISFNTALNEMTRRGKGKARVAISQNTKANYTRHLSSLFSWYQHNKFISDNIIQKVKPERKDVESISPEHLQKIFDGLEEKNLKKNLDLIKLKYYGAYRVEELLQAQVDDFDFQNSIVKIRNFKANRVDEIPMVEDLRKHLQQMKLPKSGRITFLSYSGIRSVWRRVLKRLNFDYHLHQLRKSRGTDLANIGVPTVFLHKFMRHENMNTTMKYYVRVDLKKMEAEINQKLTQDLTQNSSKSTVKYSKSKREQKEKSPEIV